MTIWTELLGIPLEVKYLHTKSARTRVLRAGFKGEPTVFLHGISGHLEMFSPIIAAHAEYFDVHAIDMLGHGFTDKLSAPMTVEMMAAHVADYMDAAGLERAHIVGLSLGGWTAAWFAAHYPARVLRLTLIATAGDPNSGATNPVFAETLRNMTRAGVMSDERENTRNRLLAVVADPNSMTEEMIDVRFAVYRQAEFRAALDYLLALAYPEAYSRWALTPSVLDKITAETLIVWGDEDRGQHGVGEAQGRFLKEGIRRNKFVLFLNAGHWPPFERPDDYCAVAVPFLRGGLDAVTKTRL